MSSTAVRFYTEGYKIDIHGNNTFGFKQGYFGKFLKLLKYVLFYVIFSFIIVFLTTLGLLPQMQSPRQSPYWDHLGTYFLL